MMEKIVESRSSYLEHDVHTAEMNRLRRWLVGAERAAAVVGLCGTVGVGKTTAALQLARECAGARPVLFVHAHGRTTAALAEECAQRVPTNKDGAPQPCVWLLDDVTDGSFCAGVAAPGTLVVATSRDSLSVPSVELRPWRVDDARRLLAERSGVRVQDAALPQLCELAHHLPLAIELLAVHLADARLQLPSDVARHLSVEYARQLRRTTQVDDALGLHVALTFVYHRMSVAQQRVLRQLSVIEGAFDAAMAAAVSADADVMLPELRRRRLVIDDEAGGGVRLPRAVRDYVRVRLSNSEAEASGLRYVESVVQRARAIGRRFTMGDQAGALAGFDVLRRHIEAAFALVQPDFHALPARAARLVADLIEALQDALPLRMNTTTVCMWQQARADALRRVRDTRGEIAARERLAELHAASGDEDAAVACHRDVQRLQMEWAAERRAIDLLVG